LHKISAFAERYIYNLTYIMTQVNLIAHQVINP
jgi:hypothetical protein